MTPEDISPGPLDDMGPVPEAMDTTVHSLPVIPIEDDGDNATGSRKELPLLCMKIEYAYPSDQEEGGSSFVRISSQVLEQVIPQAG
jgi:hypothetical protein